MFVLKIPWVPPLIYFRNVASRVPRPPTPPPNENLARLGDFGFELSKVPPPHPVGTGVWRLTVVSPTDTVSFDICFLLLMSEVSVTWCRKIFQYMSLVSLLLIFVSLNRCMKLSSKCWITAKHARTKHSIQMFFLSLICLLITHILQHLLKTVSFYLQQSSSSNYCNIQINVSCSMLCS